MFAQKHRIVENLLNKSCHFTFFLFSPLPYFFIFAYMNFRKLAFLGVCSLGILSFCYWITPNPTMQKSSAFAAFTPRKSDTNKIPFAPAGTAKFAHKTASIESFFRNNWRNPNEPIAFLVADQGQFLVEHYQGNWDKATKTPITAETPIHLASVSKVITATAILKLVQADEIALDQQVSAVLPQFPYTGITIRMLLNHRSGLRNYAYYCDDPKIWNKKNTLKNQDILDLFVKHKTPLDYRPDSRFAYNNTNYAMLALIIEQVTGKSYKDALQEMIFEPLGMKNTFSFDIDTDREKVSYSYMANGVPFRFDHLDGIYGDKNIYSTPQDLLKFDNARRHDDFLSAELREEMHKGYSYERAGERNYGLGMRMLEFKDGKKYLFHNGWWHGNNTSYISLEEGVTIIALTNQYSKKPYAIKKLAPLFGPYPFENAAADLE